VWTDAQEFIYLLIFGGRKKHNDMAAATEKFSYI